MAVAKGAGKRAGKKQANAEKRLRRTPDEARDAILAAARERLLKHGLDGLKIADIARDIGMSHATLIHHFGSTAGMRRALVDRMANSLLTEFLGVFERVPPSPTRRSEVLGRLFRALADERHVQLFAWLALEAADGADSEGVAWAGAPLFDRLFDRIAAQEDATGHDRDAARFGVLLAVTSAIGFGIATPWLKHAGLVAGAGEVDRFAARFAEFLGARRAATDTPS
jgi:AcrR family transcriptional regulator